VTAIRCPRRPETGREPLDRPPGDQDGKLSAHRSGGAVLIFSSDLLDYVLTYRQGQGIPGA
jgi:hypothetical protein